MSNTLKYTLEQYKLGKLFRDTSHPNFKSFCWEEASQETRDNWVSLFLEEKEALKDLRVDGELFPGEKKAKKEILASYKKENTMKEHQYSFVSAYEDVNYIRVVREAPTGTPFILVETRTRDNQAKDWNLFIHNKVLTDPRVKGFVVGNTNAFPSIKTIGPTWGHADLYEEELHSYRSIGGDGAFPGYIRREVDDLKKALNPKDTKTLVSFL